MSADLVVLLDHRLDSAAVAELAARLDPSVEPKVAEALRRVIDEITPGTPLSRIVVPWEVVPARLVRSRDPGDSWAAGGLLHLEHFVLGLSLGRRACECWFGIHWYGWFLKNARTQRVVRDWCRFLAPYLGATTCLYFPTAGEPSLAGTLVREGATLSEIMARLASACGPPAPSSVALFEYERVTRSFGYYIEAL